MHHDAPGVMGLALCYNDMNSHYGVDIYRHCDCLHRSLKPSIDKAAVIASCFEAAS